MHIRRFMAVIVALSAMAFAVNAQDYTPIFESSACPFTQPVDVTVDCGYLVVPENRSNPDSPDIRVAVAIFRHPDGNPQPDPIIYLEGGPGGSALEGIGQTFSILYKPVFEANRDLIILDQRGIGVSQPALDCPAIDEFSLDALDYVVDGEELTYEMLTDRLIEGYINCGVELAQTADLSAYNTIANAADIADLRVALGYDEVNLWGISYGTRLALGVMRDAPEGIRSVVLDSVYTPQVDLIEGVPLNLQRALDTLFAACVASPACDEAYPNLRQVYVDTVAALNEEPAVFDIENILTGETYPDSRFRGDDLTGLVFQLLYDTTALPILPKLIYDASEGQFDDVQLIYGLILAQQGRISVGATLAYQCQEEIPFTNPDVVQANLDSVQPEVARLTADLVTGALMPTICAEWNAGTSPESENVAVTSDIPTLVVAGEYDPITPPSWAVQAAETLPNSYLYIYPSTGHGATIGECARKMMIDFIENPTTEPDAACIAEIGTPRFIVPGMEPEPVTLVEQEVALINDTVLLPDGWIEAGPGVYARGQTTIDQTALVILPLPVANREFGVLTLAASFGSGPPELIEEREINGYAWGIYSLEAVGFPALMAASGGDDLQRVVILIGNVDEELNALADEILDPILTSLGD